MLIGAATAVYDDQLEDVEAYYEWPAMDLLHITFLPTILPTQLRIDSTYFFLLFSLMMVCQDKLPTTRGHHPPSIKHTNLPETPSPILLPRLVKQA
jgi:hypothetical protein